jgi:hypothetical protein
MTALSPCPVCAATDAAPILSLPQMPVFCNLLWPDQEGARRAPRGDIELGFCRQCGHIYNLVFDADLMAYTQAYENSLHFSPRFQSYASDLARSLVERYDLHGKDIIEIGSGQGDFLRMLCALGDNRGVGFDPSYVAEPAADTGPDVTFVRDYYTEQYADHPADFIYSRHVLEHLEQPRELVETLQSRPEIVVFSEVPNADFMLAHTALWDVIYEHYSYFGHLSLSRLFSDQGFRILRLDTTFGGQFLCLEATPDQDAASLEGGERLRQQTPTLAEMGDAVNRFAHNSRALLAEWRERLEAVKRAGRRVVVWGAGSKGVTFLNLLSRDGPIEFVVDINPRKHGMTIAGAGQAIVPPDFLREYRPDVVLVMNRNYAEEIAEMVGEMGLEPEFWFV